MNSCLFRFLNNSDSHCPLISFGCRLYIFCFNLITLLQLFYDVLLSYGCMSVWFFRTWSRFKPLQLFRYTRFFRRLMNRACHNNSIVWICAIETILRKVKYGSFWWRAILSNDYSRCILCLLVHIWMLKIVLWLYNSRNISWSFVW